eukprot:14413032-Alexandrium_andersonii.AAC.1
MAKASGLPCVCGWRCQDARTAELCPMARVTPCAHGLREAEEGTLVLRGVPARKPGPPSLAWNLFQSLPAE